jgi:hypothetical protein
MPDGSASCSGGASDLACVFEIVFRIIADGELLLLYPAKKIIAEIFSILNPPLKQCGNTPIQPGGAFPGVFCQQVS